MEGTAEASVVPFSFEGAQIRVVRDDHGAPWFVAKDICQVLGYSNPWDALGKHVDEDDLAKREVIDELGRAQQANHINESGLYSLILGSRLETAKRFKRWVTSEVLPSIRRYGAYAAPGPSVAHSLLRVSARELAEIVHGLQLAAQSVASVPGVKPEIVAAATLHCIHEATGLPVEPLRRALPANAEPLSSMNPTQLGAELGISAREVNTRLASLGLQFKNPRKEWELTEAGKPHGEAVPYASGRHAGYQVLWKRSVVDVLRALAIAA